jgi:hypothetical protein
MVQKPLITGYYNRLMVVKTVNSEQRLGGGGGLVRFIALSPPAQHKC